MTENTVTIDTSWARRKPFTWIREVMLQILTMPSVRICATPTVVGAERLEQINGPVIFVPNHNSHLDTSLLMTVFPYRIRKRIAVAAGSDYPLFFKSRKRAIIWAMWMNVIPIDRNKFSRQSIRFAQSLLEDGWHLLIYPEGTRGNDNFMLDFKPGAAYLAAKGNVAVVPIFLEGTRKIFPPYKWGVRPGKTKVIFGNPMFAAEGEKPQQFNERIQRAVELCADEGRTNWQSASARAAKGETPSLRTPNDAEGWKQAWENVATPEGNPRHKKWPL